MITWEILAALGKAGLLEMEDDRDGKLLPTLVLHGVEFNAD